MKAKLSNLSFYSKLFLALLVFHLIFYAIFRHLHTAPQTYDSAGHMALAFKFAYLYKDFLSGGETTLYDILTTSFYYPPLMHWVGGLITLIFGKSFNLMLYMVFFTFLGCLVLIRKIILELGFGERVAFYSAFFYSFFPFAADQARLFHTDIPMTFFLLIALYFLIKSHAFKVKKYTLLFFAVCGLGMLIRWFVVFYLAVPVLYALYLALVRDRAVKQVLPQLILGSFLFLVISLPWYLINLELLLIVSKFFGKGEIDDPQVFLSIENFGFYLKSILSLQAPVILAIGLLMGYRNYVKKRERGWYLVALEVIFVYLFFTFIKNKNGRYILSLLPIFAFFVSYYFCSIKRSAGKFLMVFIAVFGFLYTSFNKVAPNSQTSKFIAFFLMGPFGGEFYSNPQILSYKSETFSVGKVLEAISSDAKKEGISSIGLVATIDTEQVSIANLELFRAYLGYENMFFATPYFRERMFESNYELLKYLRDRDVSYIIDSNFQGLPNLRHYFVIKQIHEFLESEEGQKWFEEVYRADVSEDVYIKVFRRKKVNEELPLGKCMQASAFEGIIGLNVDPLASLVVFTPSFRFNGVRKGYEPESTRMLELNNYGLEPVYFVVEDLPQFVSICHRSGTEVKIMKEVALALRENLGCGGVCSKVIHTRILPNGKESTLVYDKNQVLGEGVLGLSKRLKIYPFYIEPYSLKRDIIEELGNK